MLDTPSPTEIDADALAELECKSAAEVVAIDDAHRSQDCPKRVVEPIARSEQRQGCRREHIDLGGMQAHLRTEEHLHGIVAVLAARVAAHIGEQL